MPTAWFELAKITRFAPARRAASNAAYVPPMFGPATSAHDASTLTTPARWITVSQPANARTSAAASCTSAITSASCRSMRTISWSRARSAHSGLPIVPAAPVTAILAMRLDPEQVEELFFARDDVGVLERLDDLAVDDDVV